MIQWPQNPVGVRFQGLFAPDEHALRQRVARIVEAEGVFARVIDLGVGHAEHVRRHRHARAVARPAALRVAYLCAVEHAARYRRAPVRHLPAGSHPGDDGVLPVLLAHLARLRLDHGVCLVPAYALPRRAVAPLRRVALQGVEHPVGMVDVLGKREQPHRRAAVRDGVLGVALDLLDNALPVDVYEHARSRRMVARRRPRRRARNRVAALRPCDGPAVLARYHRHLLHCRPPFLFAMRRIALRLHRSGVGAAVSINWAAVYGRKHTAMPPSFFIRSEISSTGTASMQAARHDWAHAGLAPRAIRSSHSVHRCVG